MQGEGQPICGSWAGASGHMQFMPETYPIGVSYCAAREYLGFDP